MPIAVPEVMTSGRFDPASTEPSASIARRSFPQFATKWSKSCSKAVWIKASHSQAPRRRLPWYGRRMPNTGDDARRIRWLIEALPAS